jgi:hypothetical protein
LVDNDIMPLPHCEDGSQSEVIITPRMVRFLSDAPFPPASQLTHTRLFY